MSPRTLPRYPIYVPSRGRADPGLTAKFLLKDSVPFHLVVEPAERDAYASRFGAEHVLVLPWDNPPGTIDGLIKARNWIKAHSIAAGYARHWQLDDNIRQVYRSWKGKRFPCDSGPAFRAVEDFVDRYENVAVAGMNYHMFGLPQNPPYFLNVHVYSCTLVNNTIPHTWRLAYNDDTDLCLQVLADGWCTVLVNVFLAEKMRTMTVKGGNTTIYVGDGRRKMARSLERVWPGVVETKRRFQRPQHVVKDAWRKFDTPLRLRELPPAKPNEYGLALTAVKKVHSPVIQAIYDATPKTVRGDR